MNPYSLGLYEKALPNNLTIREKLQFAKNAGYDFLELSIDETDEKLNRLNMSLNDRNKIINDIIEVGIPIKTICLSGHRKYPLGSNDYNTEQKSLEIMEKALILAYDLGITIIQLAGYDVYYENSDTNTIKRFEKNLYIATEMASKYGVLLGFETMETEFMNTISKAMKYVKLVNSPYLNVYPDCGNITNSCKNYNISVTDDIKSGSGHIIAMHLKETLPGKFREIPYGQGHVNFSEVIREAYKQGVRKFVTEFWYTGSEDFKKELVNTNLMMRNLLNKEINGNVRKVKD